jgi:hypothetical protein
MDTSGPGATILHILSEFTEEEWKIIQPLTQQILIKEGSVLFEEGSQSDDLYFVESGRMDVIKKGHFLASLDPGDWIGEIAILTGDKLRTATIRAKEDSVLYMLPLAKIQVATRDDPKIYTKIVATLAKRMADRLRKTNDKTIKSMQKELEFAKMRIVMGHLIVNLLMMIASFFFILKIISVLHITPKVSTVVSIPLILLILYFTYRVMANSHYPLSDYGLTLQNWKKSIFESLMVTILLMAGTLALRWFLIHFVHEFKGHPLFGYKLLHKEHLNTALWLLITFGYSVAAPVQELIVRGCLQGSLNRFLIGEHKTLVAIVLSNLLFSTLHLQVSLPLAICVFFIGCVWGWLYSRHQTILGVSISHIIIGIWGFVIVNIFS